MRHALLVTSLLALGSGTAHAGWRTPAAGPTLSGDPEIVLTFDDGPDPRTTAKVLDTLKAHDARAIFFLVGWRMGQGDAKTSQDLVARMLREGHIVANHTMTHPQLCGMKPELVAEEIDASEQAISTVAGMPAKWFRTPYGAHCATLERMLGERNIRHFYWDIDSQEWRHNSAKRMTAFITRSLARLQGRAVILMHDTKQATVKALPEILDWLAAENAKRAEKTRRPIRVLEPSTVALELAAPGLVEFLRDAGAAGLETAGQVAAVIP
jgi:peptidoglycan/xylan/chitin deacetylase (PgdA/CDA1 family)